MFLRARITVLAVAILVGIGAAPGSRLPPSPSLRRAGPVPGSRVSVPVDATAGVVDLDGRPVDPLTVPAGTRAHVLVFTTTDCPISNRYAPETTRLAAAYAARGVRFWVVYPVPGDTRERIRAHATAFGLNLPIARDTRFELVKRTGVTVTPEVAVIDAGGRIAYRGRVDDRYVDFGVDRPVPTTRDLDRALTNLLAGRPIEPRTTRAVGCILSDLLR